jgi:hypothetical protein
MLQQVRHQLRVKLNHRRGNKFMNSKKPPLGGFFIFSMSVYMIEQHLLFLFSA